MPFAFAAAGPPLRTGDFVLCTTSLRGWTSAIPGVLHDPCFKGGKCGNLLAKTGFRVYNKGSFYG